MNETLFISDLHLSPSRPATIELFLHFLAKRAYGSDSLYILGDLFDAWIGDDDDTPPYPAIIAALRALSDSGTKLFIQRGNRDFLLGSRFAKSTGGRLIRDPVCVDLYGIATLLMHGDLLCSDDINYQRFRRLVRNPILIRLFLLRSLKARRRQADAYRQLSSTAMEAKSVFIMDVNQHTVENYMYRFKTQRLIHGHTHRPGQQQFFINGNLVDRWVLAEWHPEQTSVLCINATDIWVEQVYLDDTSPTASKFKL